MTHILVVEPEQGNIGGTSDAKQQDDGRMGRGDAGYGLLASYTSTLRYIS